MKSMTYLRKNNDNSAIGINPDTQPEITHHYSLSNYAKAGLAIAGTVGTVALANTVGLLPSFRWGNNAAVDNPYQLMNPQERMSFVDNNFLVQPRHAKRAGFSSEFQINTYTLGRQQYPSVAALSTGDFVVVWNGQDGNRDGVYARQFSNTGIPQGNEFQVNIYTTSSQGSPSVVGLITGDFMVVWQSYGQDAYWYGIYGQRFSNIGIPQGGEFRVNTYTINAQSSPSVTTLTTGGVVVVWQSYGQDAYWYGIYGQRFSNTGVPQGSEFQINTYTTLAQENPSVAALTTGGFVVVWQSSGQDGDGSGIYGRRFSNTGIPQGSEFRVNTYTIDAQSSPSVTTLTTGGFVVVWQSYGQDAYWYGIYGQRYSSTGILQGSEFQLNTYTAANQDAPSIAALTTGDFVVVWQSGCEPTCIGQDGSSYGIYGRIYFNEAPVLANNDITVNEGETVILNLTNLSATDIDTHEVDLIFTVSNIQHAQFEQASNPGIAITSFTQQDIIDDAIQFVHDGSEAAPSYNVTVSDGGATSESVSARITFNSNNDAPVLINNGLVVNRGEIVILTQGELSAFDSDNMAFEMVYTVKNVQNSQFEQVSNPGAVITSFTQQNIIDREIQFVDDGSKNSPAYDVSVSDGLETPPSEAAKIVYIARNQLITKPGERLILSPQNLEIQTQLAPNMLEILLSDVQYGRFEKNANPGIAVFSFTLSDLDAGRIQFIHSGTEHVPQFTLYFKDLSANYTFSQKSTPLTILNHPPIVSSPTGTLNWPLNKASSYPIPNTLFSDPDGQQLQLFVKELNDNPLPQWIQFDNTTNILTGTPTTSGFYDFKIIARDPYDEIVEDRFAVDIKANNGTSIIGEGNNPVPIVAAIAGGATLLSGCIAAGILYFKNAQDRKTREQHEFARKVRHHLGLQKIDNFKSEKGQQFIQAIQSLTNLLYDGQGIDITNMDDNRLEELASDIAAAAKNKINPATVGLWKKSNITIQEFADNIHEIAKDNSLSGLGRNGDDINIPMHTIDNTADNNLGTLIEDGINTVRNIFSPKMELV